MGIDAGSQRKIVVIEQRTSIPDGSGEPQMTWQFFMQRRASIVKTVGREIWTANERSGRVPTTFSIRFPRQLTVLPQMRLTCDGVLYDILSASDPDGMKAELVLTCLEYVGEPLS
jgi:SPP1 family predicted phage head-tail adaptor